MKLYHGSPIAVHTPNINRGRRNTANHSYHMVMGLVAQPLCNNNHV